MPVQQLAVGLDPGGHARDGVRPAQEALRLGLDAAPRAATQLARELLVVARVDTQPLRDGEHELPVRHGQADLFGHVPGIQERALLVATGAGAALLAGERDEHLVPTVRAPYPGEALVQVPAAEIRLDRAADDRAPIPVLRLVALVIHPLELLYASGHSNL